MKKFKVLFYTGLFFVLLPIVVFNILLVASISDKSNKQSKKIDKEKVIVYDTVKVKVIDTVVVKKIKYIKKEKDSSETQ